MSWGSVSGHEETDFLLEADRSHHLRLTNRIKDKLKRRCSFQVSIIFYLIYFVLIVNVLFLYP